MLAEEIVDEEGNDAEDEELELEPEAPPPPPPVDDVAVVDVDVDDGYITVDADLAAADAVDAVEAADVAEDEAWRAAREACLVRDNGGLELELENVELFDNELGVELELKFIFIIGGAELLVLVLLVEDASGDKLRDSAKASSQSSSAF